ncbi:MAG: cysteine--tRNA ligase [Myxococcales bacterium]|nr:cysteine--tRNA ligase [Myxococcales bacterium]MCB9550529.1 cysteine--tRNA ligase [Myxococcales bacterium]
MAIQIHDTLSGTRRPFEPIEAGKVKMYVCGVTPYARSHLGHARCYTAYDIVYRYLRFAGFEVTYVRNFTDVDDKIIKAAADRGIDPLALAQENIDSFHADMDALGIARPQHEPRVSTSIDEIVALVQRLEARGLAYAVDGDVYYAVEKFEGYGKLGKRDLDSMLAGARVEVDERKRHPMDFALWKAAKPGEPKWPSPWGDGRPGWHIECSAMSMSALGETFDLHGGGRDLIFPHHENEIAQSEGATGCTFAHYWLHNGFITLDEEKMSKSLGNVFSVGDILERYEPQVLRFFFVTASQYRNPINFSDAMLDEAASRVAYCYDTLRKADAFLAEGHAEHTGPIPAQKVIDELLPRFREAMDDDFNVPRAMDPVNEAFRTLNELIATKKAGKRAAAAVAAGLLVDALRDIDTVLNLFGEDAESYLERHRDKAVKRRGLDVAWVEQRISARIAARTARDWKRADEIRDEMQARGVVLMDHADGTDWRVLDTRDDVEAERST